MQTLRTKSTITNKNRRGQTEAIHIHELNGENPTALALNQGEIL